MRIKIRWAAAYFSAAMVIMLLTAQSIEGEVLYEEDFGAAKLDGWMIVDEGKVSAPSDWKVKDGALVQASNIYSDGSPACPGTMAVRGSPEWGGYVLELRLRSTDNDGLGAVFCYQDEKNYYRFRWMGTDPSSKEGQVLEKQRNGAWTILASNASQYRDSAWHSLRIVLNGTRILAFVDDMIDPVFDVRDAKDSLGKGKIGLYSWGNQSSFFDDLKLSKRPLVIGLRAPVHLIQAGGTVAVRAAFVNSGSTDLPVQLTTDAGLRVASAERTFTVKAGEARVIDVEIAGLLPGRGSLKFSRKDGVLLGREDFLVMERLDFLPLFGDFHMHTKYSDGSGTPFEMLVRARGVGLDLVAITDHRTTAGSRAARWLLESVPMDVLVLHGEENAVDFPDAHILGINIPDGAARLRDLRPGDGPEQLAAWAMGSGVLIFQAHPVWESHSGTRESKLAFTESLLKRGLITGIELVNEEMGLSINEGMPAFYQSLLDGGMKVPILGNSDAHKLADVGKVRTIVFAPAKTAGAVAAAIREGRTVVMNGDGSLLYGPEPYKEIARIIVRDYLPLHDALAAREAEAASMYWGGMIEKKEELAGLRKEWEALYRKCFPFFK